MSLARHYAQVFKELDPKNVLAYMKERGHLSVLPQVVRILEREKPRTDTLVVAKAEDAHSFKKENPEATVIVDPKIVGGFVSLKGTTLTDQSYRRALINLYQKITE